MPRRLFHTSYIPMLYICTCICTYIHAYVCLCNDLLVLFAQLGEELVTGNHYKAAEISDKVANLTKQWDTLNANCADKGHKLNEANELQLFLRAVEEVAMWMSLAEALLASEDLGKDLQSTKFLLRKHQVLTHLCIK